VNRGIIEGHHKGIVSSTCVMTNISAAATGIPDAQRKAPKLGLGLHLTLSYGAPVSPPEIVPSLVNDAGKFVSNYSGLMAKIASFAASDLATELKGQFDRFVELANTLPDHIDSHHRAAYLHPAAFEVMMQLVEKHQLPIRRPAWLDGATFAGVPTNTDGKLVAQLQRIYDQYHQPKCPDVMIEIFYWDRRSRVEPIRDLIHSLQDGYTELICHVGYGEDLEEDFNFQRNYDLAGVIDPSIVTLVKDNPDIQLITFADLPE
jgi:predicted glycoside hydrolase/deacetylase ChbG (UPF0249 family)